MLEKANQFAISLGVEGFTASNGWFERCKSCNNIKFTRSHGEKAAANCAGAEDWINNVLPREIQGYAARDIFNADETGLIYHALQSGTLLFEGDKPAGGKVPKEHLTALVSVNMDGTEKDLWIIGKLKKPRCFS